MNQLDPPVTEAKPVLGTRGLRKRFGRFAAVDGLDLTVREGEIYGFLGRNGAGKTTTIRMLMGIIRPDGGEIELLGRVSPRASIAQKRMIGYVSQDQYFYPWMSCRRLGKFSSGFYPNWDMQEFERLLLLLDLPPRRRFSQLSGGMRVKLALALALAHRPPLLILDEPTSSLDPVSRREFLDIIESQARHYGRTTFFSSHRIDEVERVADRIGIIHQGRLRYEGGVDHLKASIRRVSFPPAPPPPMDPFAGPGATPTAPPPVPQLPVPGGFELLKTWEEEDGRSMAILHAEPAAWEAPVLPPGTEVAPLPLEDLFIAYAGAEKVEL